MTFLTDGGSDQHTVRVADFTIFRWKVAVDLSIVLKAIEVIEVIEVIKAISREADEVIIILVACLMVRP